MDEKTIRLSVPIDRKVNDELAALLPHGLKAQVIRSLVTVFIKAQREYGEERWIAEDLIKNRCQLVVQNLNISAKEIT